MVSKFNKQEAEHEITTMKLTHVFALKMATMICMSVVGGIILLGIFFGAITPIALIITIILAIIFGAFAFSATRSAII